MVLVSLGLVVRVSFLILGRNEEVRISLAISVRSRRLIPCLTFQRWTPLMCLEGLFPQFLITELIRLRLSVPATAL